MFERETRDAAGISNRSGSTDVFIFVGGALVPRFGVFDNFAFP